MSRFAPVFDSVVAAAPWKGSSARRVLVEVKSWEAELRKKVQEAGGRWVPKTKRWSMRYDRAIGLGLNERVSFHAPHAAPTPNFSTDMGTRKSTDVGTSPRFRGKGL